jgi:hypothetical protein
VHVAVAHDLVSVAHRRQRGAVPLGDREHLHLAECARPRRDQRVGRLAIGDARRVIGEAVRGRSKTQIEADSLAEERGFEPSVSPDRS